MKRWPAGDTQDPCNSRREGKQIDTYVVTGMASTLEERSTYNIKRLQFWSLDLLYTLYLEYYSKYRVHNMASDQQ